MEFHEGQWYCTYWVNQHIVLLHGPGAEVRRQVNDTVIAEARLRFQSEVVTLKAVGRYGVPAFPQTPLALQEPPPANSTIEVCYAVKPKWYQGRQAKRYVDALVQIILPHERLERASKESGAR